MGNRLGCGIMTCVMMNFPMFYLSQSLVLLLVSHAGCGEVGFNMNQKSHLCNVLFFIAELIELSLNLGGNRIWT